MLFYENFLGQNLVPFFGKSVYKLLIEHVWRQKLHRETFTAIDIGCLILRLNDEFGHKLLLAVRAINGVLRLILSELTKELFLADRSLTRLTLLLQFNVQ